MVSRGRAVSWVLTHHRDELIPLLGWQMLEGPPHCGVELGGTHLFTQAVQMPEGLLSCETLRAGATPEPTSARDRARSSSDRETASFV